MRAHHGWPRDPPALPLAHLVEAAETEVEEGRRDEGEECEEEKEPEDGAGREEAIEASEKKVRGCRGALGGGEERERRRLPPGPEEDPPHSLRFSWRSPRTKSSSTRNLTVPTVNEPRPY